MSPERTIRLRKQFLLFQNLPLKNFRILDVSINLGVDPRKSDQVVRGSTILPAGTGKTVRVAVFHKVKMRRKQKRQALT
ncbi:MAG: hypothetical protein Ct9H90mP27_2840 [Gammaproteobacteria bacterium]|nr:MAG: hypothetical protein Ct9H90mP27_2840 [Gammaproteobacteria bacterium]